MPIRFRCGYCNRLLGIARRKAGTETTCPHCGYTLTVPEEAEANEEVPDITGMEDLDELLNPMSIPEPEPEPPKRSPSAQSSPGSYPATYPKPSPAATSAAPPNPRPSPPASSPRSSGERPVLGPSFESILNAPNTASDPRLSARPAPASSTGATGLPDDRGQIVLSARKAAFLAIVVVVLIGVSFAAGFLIAANR